MSADKYPSIFSRQMEAIVYICFKSPRVRFRGTKYEIYHEHVFLLYLHSNSILGLAIIKTVCKYGRLILITDNIFAFIPSYLHTFISSEMPSFTSQW